MFPSAWQDWTTSSLFHTCTHWLVWSVLETCKSSWCLSLFHPCKKKTSTIFFNNFDITLGSMTSGTWQSCWLLLPRLGITKDFLLVPSICSKENAFVLKHDWGCWIEMKPRRKRMRCSTWGMWVSCLWITSSLHVSTICFTGICTINNFLSPTFKDPIQTVH